MFTFSKYFVSAIETSLLKFSNFFFSAKNVYIYIYIIKSKHLLL